jgi:hypothetical protein
MPNFIDSDRVSMYAAEIAAAAGLGGDLAKRFTVVAAKFVHREADCAKPLKELPDDALAWARTLAANGGTVHEFCPPPAVTERLRHAATGLLLISRASDGLVGRGRSSESVIDRLGRMNFCQLEKAITDWVARRTRDQRADPDIERCPPTRVDVATGRCWVRVTTLRQLDETGEALKNCLARTHPRHKPHWKALCDGSAEYWQLLRRGRTACVIEIETDSRVVRDVRARENRVPCGFIVEIRALMQTVGAVSPPIGELTGSEPLMAIGLVGPAAARAESDVAGKVRGRSYEVWVEDGIAVIRLGKQNPEFVIVDANRRARRFAELMTATAYADPTDVIPVLVQAAKSNPAALAPAWQAFVVAADRCFLQHGYSRIVRNGPL